MENEQLEQLIHRALRAQKAVWTLQCLTPETLLKCVELQEAYSPDAADLDHFIGCAYCRRHAVVLCEIRALAELPNPPVVTTTKGQNSGNRVITPPFRPENIPFLPAGIRAWASELLANGILAPLEEAIRAAFDQMERLLAPPVAVRSATTRSAVAFHNLRPSITAVPSPQPTLQWQEKGGGTAQAVEVVIARPGESPWQGRADMGSEFIVPKEAGLKPGGIYRWQVSARDDEDEYAAEKHSFQASFIVLSETQAQQVAALEQEAGDSLLARLSVYEAYGLYDDALHSLESLPSAERDETAIRLHAHLCQHLKLETIEEKD